MRRREEPIRIKKAWRPNMKGVIIFMFISVYLIVSFIHSLSKVKTSIYRVISDTRTEAINERGIILRDEKVFSAANSGYINYYINSLGLTGKNDIVYTIDSTGNIYSNLTSEETAGEESENRLKSIFLQYHSVGEDFFSVYSLKETLKEKALIQSGQSVLTNLKNVIENYGNNSYFHLNYSPESGIVVFGTDGFENLKENEVDIHTFEKEEEMRMKLPPENSTKVDVGTPIYKLIRDEIWKVIVPITDEQSVKLSEKEYVDVILDGSTFKAKAKAETFIKDGAHFAVLTFYNYMVNFADKRFINVYISLDNVTGLKIAKSAVVEKKFYVIPSDFLVSKDERFVEKGINLLTFDKKGTPTFRFIETTVFFEKDGNSYIASDGEFSAGDRIAKIKNVDVVAEDDNEFLTTISKVDTLSGVYNVNKGYPLFRRIEVISDIDSDYYLISDKTEFGLSDYDNIVLNAAVLEGKQDDKD